MASLPSMELAPTPLVFLHLLELPQRRHDGLSTHSPDVLARSSARLALGLGLQPNSFILESGKSCLRPDDVLACLPSLMHGRLQVRLEVLLQLFQNGPNSNDQLRRHLVPCHSAEVPAPLGALLLHVRPVPP